MEKAAKIIESRDLRRAQVHNLCSLSIYLCCLKKKVVQVILKYIANIWNHSPWCFCLMQDAGLLPFYINISPKLVFFKGREEYKRSV